MMVLRRDRAMVFPALAMALSTLAFRDRRAERPVSALNLLNEIGAVVRASPLLTRGGEQDTACLGALGAEIDVGRAAAGAKQRGPVHSSADGSAALACAAPRIDDVRLIVAAPIRAARIGAHHHGQCPGARGQGRHQHVLSPPPRAGPVEDTARVRDVAAEAEAAATAWMIR